MELINPVLSGLLNGFSLADQIRRRAIQDQTLQVQQEREKRFREENEIQKRLAEQDFQLRARGAGARPLTDAQRVEAETGRSTSLTSRVEDIGGRRTIVPRVEQQASDLGERVLTSGGGAQFLLPSDAEIEAARALEFRRQLDQDAERERRLGRVRADVEIDKRRDLIPVDINRERQLGMVRAEADIRKQRDLLPVEEERAGRTTTATERAREPFRQAADKRSAKAEADRQAAIDRRAKRRGGSNATGGVSSNTLAGQIERNQKEVAELEAEVGSLSVLVNTGRAPDGQGGERELVLSEVNTLQPKLRAKQRRLRQLQDEIARKRKLLDARTQPASEGGQPTTAEDLLRELLGEER